MQTYITGNLSFSGLILHLPLHLNKSSPPLPQKEAVKPGTMERLHSKQTWCGFNLFV